jgi:hypothetical protein
VWRDSEGAHHSIPRIFDLSIEIMRLTLPPPQRPKSATESAII